MYSKRNARALEILRQGPPLMTMAEAVMQADKESGKYLEADGVVMYVTIHLAGSKWFEGRNHWRGPVISKANYRKGPGEPDCWYVEFMDEQWGYCYIKQDQDGDGIFKDATFTFDGPMGVPLNGRVV